MITNKLNIVPNIAIDVMKITNIILSRGLINSNGTDAEASKECAEMFILSLFYS